MPNCRECPSNIRERCIEESATSSSVKLMMHRAFKSGTDTQDLWGLLRINCLLERKKQKPKKRRPSSLGRRLKGKTKPPEDIKMREKAAPSPSPAPPRARKPAPPKKKKEEPPTRHCLLLQDGQHRIALPVNGELVLGRFDPTIRVTPDVDLSYDDAKSHVISRRHARIIGLDNVHKVEDMGSTNGTQVNGKILDIGQKIQLKKGDYVSLGHCKFIYTSMPPIPLQVKPLQAYLQVAFTGRRIPLPTWGKGIIGRRDETINFIPEIDLSEEGEAAHVIARRHVRISTHSGRHYAEDLGSANGTKLNGVRLNLGQQKLLNPGDHLWLGGCVLAYDIEREADKENSNQ